MQAALFEANKLRSALADVQKQLACAQEQVESASADALCARAEAAAASAVKDGERDALERELFEVSCPMAQCPTLLQPLPSLYMSVYLYSLALSPSPPLTHPHA